MKKTLILVLCLSFLAGCTSVMLTKDRIDVGGKKSVTYVKGTFPDAFGQNVYTVDRYADDGTPLHFSTNSGNGIVNGFFDKAGAAVAVGVPIGLGLGNIQPDVTNVGGATSNTTQKSGLFVK